MIINCKKIRVYNYPQFLFIIILNFLSINPSSSRLVIDTPLTIPSRISYTQNCGQFIPKSTPTGNPITTIKPPTFLNAYVTNGGQFLGPTSQITSNLIPRSLYNTSSSGVLQFEANFIIRVYNYRRNLLNVYGGGHKFGVNTRSVRFLLSGFWNLANGNICMVGFGTRRLSNGNSFGYDVVFKSHYPYVVDVMSSLVVGTLESLNVDGSDSHFEPISIMGFSRSSYEYSLINEGVNDDEFEVGGEVLSNVSLGGWGWNSVGCSYLWRLCDSFEVFYRSSCDGQECKKLDKVFGLLPRFMSSNEIECNDRMFRVAFGFSESSDVRHGSRRPLDPRKALVAEGAWNEKKNQLRFVACRILNVTDSPLSASVGDCSIRVNFTFPAFLTIRNPSVIMGHIWSNKSVDEPGYFDRSEIRASGSLREAPREMKYNYTEVERAKRYCAEKKDTKQKGKSFPDPLSHDLKFDMDVRNGKGQSAWGRSHPVFIGDRFVLDTYPRYRYSVTPLALSDVQGASKLSGSPSITYQIIFSPTGEFKVGSGSLPNNQSTILSAEGTYDTESGRICMVGCWNRGIDTMDCDIFVNIQIPSRDSKGGEKVKGTIESKRKKSDALYFDRLDLTATSLTNTQVNDAFWRMDFEITMVLISNTLTCIFVGLQLFHVKRHPDVLPFISLVMLTVITLGHMIPLLLNMEAFFLSRPSKRTVLFGSGGWLEVNEVLVRVITMLAFLLEFRLLQLTWYSRGTEGTLQNLGASEKKVILYSLPVYAGGALIAWIIQKLRGPQITHFRRINGVSNASLPFWNGIKSFVGFVQDAFLLPQIMFNVFSDSKDKALSLPFYVGTTIVRLLPHGYDLFRAHSSSWKFDPWYIYANPGMNYFSTTWDILISCLGVIFVVIIFLQQRFGGQWVLPRRFKQSIAYERVPVGL